MRRILTPTDRISPADHADAPAPPYHRRQMARSPGMVFLGLMVVCETVPQAPWPAGRASALGPVGRLLGIWGANTSRSRSSAFWWPAMASARSCGPLDHQCSSCVRRRALFDNLRTGTVYPVDSGITIS